MEIDPEDMKQGVGAGDENKAVEEVQVADTED